METAHWTNSRGQPTKGDLHSLVFWEERRSARNTCLNVTQPLWFEGPLWTVTYTTKRNLVQFHRKGQSTPFIFHVQKREFQPLATWAVPYTLSRMKIEGSWTAAQFPLPQNRLLRVYCYYSGQRVWTRSILFRLRRPFIDFLSSLDGGRNIKTDQNLPNVFMTASMLHKLKIRTSREMMKGL